MWNRDGAHEYVGWSPSCCMVWEKDLVVKGVVGVCFAYACILLRQPINGTHTILKIKWPFRFIYRINGVSL
jgi:hypothetical protein